MNKDMNSHDVTRIRIELQTRLKGKFSYPILPLLLLMHGLPPPPPIQMPKLPHYFCRSKHYCADIYHGQRVESGLLGPKAIIIGRGTAITKGLRLAESQPQEHSKTTMIHNYITVIPWAHRNTLLFNQVYSTLYYNTQVWYNLTCQRVRTGYSCMHVWSIIALDVHGRCDYNFKTLWSIRG